MRIKLLFIALLSMITVNAQTVEQMNILFEDSFETYDDFSINTVGNWITLDLDQSPTVGSPDFFWQNKYKPHAFIVFNPATTISPTKLSKDFSAKKGDKYMGSWGAIIPKEGGKKRNDDWLISPPVRLEAGGNKVSFWVKSLIDQTRIRTENALEKYRVGVYIGSGIPTKSDDFIPIAAIGDEQLTLEAPMDWEQQQFNLDAYANQIVRIGIHSMSKEKHFFMLDDFKVTASTTLKTPDFFAKNFVVFPNPAQEVLNIVAKNGMEVKGIQVTDLNGRIVKSATVQGQTEAQINVSDLTVGVYFVSVRTDDGIAVSRFLKK